MGGHMARNLLKAGHSVVAYDVMPEAVARVTGAKAAKHVREVAQQCSTIVTMLPSTPHVMSVYTGDDGLLGAMHPGTLCIESSTIDPMGARKVAEAVRARGGSLVDAPVSGGVLGAEAGSLTFMVGGEKESFELAREVLKHMGKTIVHCGAVGNGQVVKICNNLILAISMAGVSEAMALGVALGMDAKVMAGIINTSSGRCWSSDTYNPVPGVLPGVPSSRGYTGGFACDLMAKDVSLAINAAHAVKSPLPLGGSVLQLYNLLSLHGYGGKDFSAVYDYLAKKKQ